MKIRACMHKYPCLHTCTHEYQRIYTYAHIHINRHAHPYRSGHMQHTLSLHPLLPVPLPSSPSPSSSPSFWTAFFCPISKPVVTILPGLSFHSLVPAEALTALTVGCKSPLESFFAEILTKTEGVGSGAYPSLKGKSRRRITLRKPESLSTASMEDRQRTWKLRQHGSAVRPYHLPDFYQRQLWVLPLYLAKSVWETAYEPGG